MDGGSSNGNNDNSSKKYGILVVEDNPDVSSLLSALIRLKGMESVKARTLEECTERIHGPDRIAVAVMNGRLAMEKGGVLISMIKQASPDTPILGIVEDDSDRANMLRLGCDDFAKKPVSAETIIDKVLVLMAKKQNEAAAASSRA
ncbi:response regulator [Nitrososphaera sp.]|uniref:response regulator n=1 Tax=Nitrososphaera sp. TaxID=1971748 RepID=UPI00307E068D